MPPLIWLPEALDDLRRLHAFLAEKSPEAAARLAVALLEGADQLIATPHLGRPHPPHGREWLVRFGLTRYVMRYRTTPTGEVVVLRVWHEREDR